MEKKIFTKFTVTKALTSKVYKETKILDSKKTYSQFKKKCGREINRETSKEEMQITEKQRNVQQA